MFEFIHIVTLQAMFECQKDGKLPPYLGSTIRGIMGHCIRDFYCDCPAVKCFQCNKKNECFYVQYFSNTGGEAGAINPYTLYVHGNGKTNWKKGDICIFELTIFGKAAEQVYIYFDALKAMEDKGWGSERLPFRLIQVMDAVSERLIYAGGRSWMRNLTPVPLKIEARNASHAFVHFDTLLRIVSGDQLFTSLPFRTFMQFLIRRISLVTAVCTGYEVKWEEDKLLECAQNIRIQAEEWREVPFVRYSMNQKNGKLELPARTGWVLYEGDLSQFVPFLEVGKYLRIGKGATIGFGHYEISYDR